MSAAPDPVTVALTGLLPGGLIAGALLAYPLARLLLRLYHRSVARGMAAFGGAAAAVPAAAPGRPPPRPLAIEEMRAAGTASPLLRAPWRAALAYGLAGSAFAAAMTAFWLIATRDAEIVATKLLVLFWTYFFPAVLAVNLVAGLRRHHRLALGAYFACYALLVGIALARNPEMRWFELPVFWLLIDGPPAVLLAAFLARRIRAVGPLVLAFTVIALVGSQIPAAFLSNDEALLRAVSDFGFAAGLGAIEVFAAILLSGLLAFALAGWLVLKLVGRLYQAKLLSDEMLTLDAMFLLFGVSHAINLVFEGWGWIFSGLGAYAAFVVVRWAAFAALRAPARPAPRRLLLLRVFALGRRSERLFDLLRKHWLRSGDIAMIAGPDLVTSTIEPHEFLEFLAGGLSRQFVKDRADLERRLGGIDAAPDPDLRYRVNEFFCHADTWQMTMRALAPRSDAVLMDLRSFSPANQGCLFELGELLNGVELGRVVFVIDATTDRAFLESALGSLWQAVAADSPNLRHPEPAARLFDFGRGPEGEALRGLLAALS